jgi:hypothetical protein
MSGRHEDPRRGPRLGGQHGVGLRQPRPGLRADERGARRDRRAARGGRGGRGGRAPPHGRDEPGAVGLRALRRGHREADAAAPADAGEPDPVRPRAGQLRGGDRGRAAGGRRPARDPPGHGRAAQDRTADGGASRQRRARAVRRLRADGVERRRRERPADGDPDEGAAGLAGGALRARPGDPHEAGAGDPARGRAAGGRDLQPQPRGAARGGAPAEPARAAPRRDAGPAPPALPREALSRDGRPDPRGDRRRRLGRLPERRRVAAKLRGAASDLKVPGRTLVLEIPASGARVETSA